MSLLIMAETLFEIKSKPVQPFTLALSKIFINRLAVWVTRSKLLLMTRSPVHVYC